MEKPIESYWKVRLNDLRSTLDGNNFEAFVADNKADARRIVLEEILPKLGPKTISWGGSMTFQVTGLYEALKGMSGVEVLDTYDKSKPAEKVLELRRKALLVDLFITGTNAVTESGMLVNLDMIGNRVGAITFGPRNVLILVGRNKIVSDLYCEDCKAGDRICNYWTITEKSYPKGRVKVVLINEDLGI
ncbi:MAG: lactate utilization protein [Deltaproteobacteria bacterium]|nr:lactate utilization protein [Deltaproteobacteria bacterium]